MTAAVLVAAAAVVALVFRFVLSGREKVVDRSDAAMWHVLQLVAIALRAPHVPWPPSLQSAFTLVSDVVLLDLRPLARFLLGCEVLSHGLDPFYLHWGLTLGFLVLALLCDAWGLVRACAPRDHPPGHLYKLLRVCSPVFVLAACEALACQTVRHSG